MHQNDLLKMTYDNFLLTHSIGKVIAIKILLFVILQKIIRKENDKILINLIFSLAGC